MNLAERYESQQYETEQTSAGLPTPVTAAFEGSNEIAAARTLARDYLASLRDVHGRQVTERAVDLIQLVVSELVTNAAKYAPGPCLLTLDAGENEDTLQITAWDSSTTLPIVQRPDPARIGQHGLEIVNALCRSLKAHRAPVGKRITATIALTTPDPHR
ncbi:ATP-binding protein [Streptomyces sp. NPDC005548]|uniref:ATP-binding protein n=1 Tax=Streptomyces sp. NPDC005548 TaxID=3364724 RepID=UPI00369D3A8E